MRLIDADDFYKRIKSNTDICAEMEKDGEMALKKYIDLQPTAYDVDEVMDGLKEPQYDIQLSTGEHCAMIPLSDAIQIVKRGGIDEW